MIHPGDNDQNMSVSVFVIDPHRVVRAILYYPGPSVATWMKF
jgi:alkyl hydroperoxide reductase subunit AhpC